MDLKFVLMALSATCCFFFVAEGQGSYYSFYRERSRELEAKRQRQSRSRPLIQSRSKPSYLDPMNFQLPEMTVAQMQTILREIEMHIRPKQNNLEFYSGARMLIMLLQEECFKLRRSGDPRVNQFCNSFSNRFRSFF